MKELSPYELDFNVFNKFGKEWALIVCNNDTLDNAMTISWGQMGILWSRPTATVYVGNTRFTKPILDNINYFSISFFSKEYHDKLAYCGTVSRKDEDKISKCNFTRLYDENNTLYLKDAEITFIVKKIYQSDLPILEDTDPTIKKHYQPNEYHTQYICQIEKVIIKEKE